MLETKIPQSTGSQKFNTKIEANSRMIKIHHTQHKLLKKKYLLPFQVVETKRELYPPENKSHRKEIEETIRTVREKKDRELMQALEEIEKRAQ